MDIRKVKKLIELLEESGMTEIEIHEGEESVRISRGQLPVVQANLPQHYAPEPIVSQNIASKPTKVETPAAEGNQISSPMVGTFYVAASPESAPFVQIGTRVNIGDTLCIIEAMKIMNPIEAEIAGTISAILVDNGFPVEFGQPLFVIS